MTKRQNIKKTRLEAFLTDCGAMRDRIVSGRDPKRFAILCKTLSKQRKQLHILIKNITHCIKCMECCLAIKGLILPLNEIKKLLSNFNKNIQKIKCYETRIVHWRTQIKKILGWDFLIFSVASFINAIIGIILWFHYRLSPIIYKVLFRERYQIVTTEFYAVPKNFSQRYVKRWVAEENSTFSYVSIDTLPSATARNYDPLHMENVVILSIFCITYVLIVLSVPLLEGIRRAIGKTFGKMADTTAVEREYTMCKQFFDALYKKKSHGKNSALHLIKKNIGKHSMHVIKRKSKRALTKNSIRKHSMHAIKQKSKRALTKNSIRKHSVRISTRQSKRILRQELRGKLDSDHPRRHTMYERDLFRYDEQISRLILRLKEWSKSKIL